MTALVETIVAWLTAFLQETGYLGVFLALAIESACIPITSEIFLLFAGFLTAKGSLSLAGVTAAGVAGFAAGSLVPYYLARRHGRALLNGRRRWFVVRSEDLARVERWFERYGPRAVLIGRLIPIVRDFISIPAGLAAMPLLRFIAYTMVGSLPWIFLVALAGQFLEAHWQRLLEWVEVGNQAVLIVLALLVIALGVWLWLRRRSESPSP